MNTTTISTITAAHITALNTHGGAKLNYKGFDFVVTLNDGNFLNGNYKLSCNLLGLPADKSLVIDAGFASSMVDVKGWIRGTVDEMKDEQATPASLRLKMTRLPEFNGTYDQFASAIVDLDIEEECAAARIEALKNSPAKAIDIIVSKHYNNSAHCFKARFETELKGSYFIESVKPPHGEREYKLKCITEHNVKTVMEFENKRKALSFFSNAEFTTNGGLILERSSYTLDMFNREFNEEAQAKYMYQSAYTSAFNIWYKQEIRTYTEGDYCWVHFDTETLYKNEVESYIKFNKEHN